jgi:hypothetical protein
LFDIQASTPKTFLRNETAATTGLLKFREFVNSSQTVGKYVNKLSGNTAYSISFSSERMANVLGKYGFKPRKCFTAQVKGGIEHNKHLWRGVIDGDGSLGVYERKCLNGSVRRIPYINITGSRNALILIQLIGAIDIFLVHLPDQSSTSIMEYV